MIEVISAGIYTSIQDLGRFGHQDKGVPVSGVMDERAARIANGLLGNPETSAVLEMTMVGAKLKFNSDTAIALTGADISPEVNGQSIKNNTFVSIKAGDILSFGKIKKGFRGYLAILGGFQSAGVLDSKSMYARITTAVTLKKGTTLKIPTSKISNENRFSNIKINEDYIGNRVLEVFKGPEFDKLSLQEQNKLFSKAFIVSKNNSRMGYQLEGILKNNLKPIITAPVIPGTVQLTPSGKLIVLMRDCQTTGGYPRVLQLSKMAINSLAQKFTGEKLEFKLLT